VRDGRILALSTSLNGSEGWQSDKSMQDGDGDGDGKELMEAMAEVKLGTTKEDDDSAAE
jgi:hypothetical protein